MEPKYRYNSGSQINSFSYCITLKGAFLFEQANHAFEAHKFCEALDQ